MTAVDLVTQDGDARRYDVRCHVSIMLINLIDNFEEFN